MKSGEGEKAQFPILREGRKALTNFIQYLLSADQKIKNM